MPASNIACRPGRGPGCRNTARSGKSRVIPSRSRWKVSEKQLWEVPQEADRKPMDSSCWL